MQTDKLEALKKIIEAIKISFAKIRYLNGANLMSVNLSKHAEKIL
jgi:hypothetical protein